MLTEAPPRECVTRAVWYACGTPKEKYIALYDMNNNKQEQLEAHLQRVKGEMKLVSRELRVQAGILAVKCQCGNFGHPEDMYSEHELAYCIHEGDFETSLMLAFEPEYVDMTQAKNFKSNAESGAIAPSGPISRGWIATDHND